MDKIKWQNLVDLNANSEVLTTGLSYRMSKQSNRFGRVWVQLFGEGFDKARLAHNILKGLNQKGSDEHLMEESEANLQKAKDNLFALQRKFSLVGHDEAAATLQGAYERIGQILFKKRALADAALCHLESFSDMTEDSESMETESLNPRSIRSAGCSNRNNVSEIRDDLSQYHPEVRSTMEETLSADFKKGNEFDAVEVRRRANLKTLETLYLDYAKENVLEAIKDYCQQNTISVNDFMYLIQTGLKRFDSDIVNHVTRKCEMIHIRFATLVRSYFETLANLPSMGKKMAVYTTSYVLHRMMGRKDLSAREVYLDIYRKHFLSRTKQEMDPEAKLAILNSRERIHLLQITPAHVERFASFVKTMQPFLLSHRKLKEQEMKVLSDEKTYASQRRKLDNEIEKISREREGLETAYLEKQALQLSLNSKTEQFVQTSDGKVQLALQAEIEALNETLMKMDGSLEVKKAAVEENLADRMKLLTKLSDERQKAQDALQMMRASCKITASDFALRLDLATTF